MPKHPDSGDFVAITSHQNRKTQYELILADGTEQVSAGSREVARGLAAHWGFVQVPSEPDKDHIVRWEYREDD